MSTRRSMLVEVLYPRKHPGNLRRAAATRTIIQPDIDQFEQTPLISAEEYLGASSTSHSSESLARIAGSGT